MINLEKVFHWGCFEFFQKFAEIFANECLSPVSTPPAISCSQVSLTPPINLSLVSMTPLNNPCHGFLLIAGVVDTGDTFLTGDNGPHRWTTIASDNNTGDKFIANDKNKDAMEMGSCQGESWRGQIGDISGRWSQTRPPMVSLEPPWKSCIHRHPTNLIRDPWGRQN